MWCSEVSIACELKVGSASAGMISACGTTVTPGWSSVEPGRHLAARDDVDVADPGREQVHRTQRVAQLVARDEPRPAAGLAGLGGALHPGDPRLARGVPLGVVAVDPRVDDVDGEAALVDRRRGHQRQGPHRDAVDLQRHELLAGGDPVGVAVGPRRDQRAVGVPLPELHLDRAALPDQLPLLVDHRPRLDEQPRGHPAAQVLAEAEDRAAALGPAVLVGVAQGEVRRRAGVAELLEEGVAVGHRHHDDRAPRLVRRDHQPVVAARGGGRDGPAERLLARLRRRHAGRPRPPRPAAFGTGLASTRAVTRGVSRPAIVRRVRAALKMPTHRSAMAYASY